MAGIEKGPTGFLHNKQPTHLKGAFQKIVLHILSVAAYMSKRLLMYEDYAQKTIYACKKALH